MWRKLHEKLNITEEHSSHNLKQTLGQSVKCLGNRLHSAEGICLWNNLPEKIRWVQSDHLEEILHRLSFSVKKKPLSHLCSRFKLTMLDPNSYQSKAYTTLSSIISSETLWPQRGRSTGESVKLTRELLIAVGFIWKGFRLYGFAYVALWKAVQRHRS